MCKCRVYQQDTNISFHTSEELRVRSMVAVTGAVSLTFWCILALLPTQVASLFCPENSQTTTRLALPGTNFSYTCPCTSTDVDITGEFSTGGGIRITSTDQHIANMNNVRACYGSNSVTVFILTTLERNTSVTCTPLQQATTCTSINLCLFTVKGPPGPPRAPTLTVTNLTTITLTWTAPWSLPVKNYTITITNTSSGLVSQFIVNKEQFVLGRKGGGGQCDELVFTVEAETDVGSNGTSPNTTGGFPKDLNNFNSELIIAEKNQSNSIRLLVFYKCPVVCQYEVLNYSITFTNARSGVIIDTRQATTCTNFSTMISPSSGITEYNITLIIINEANQSHTLVKNFRKEVEAFQSTPTLGKPHAPAPTTSEAATTTTQPIPMTTQPEIVVILATSILGSTTTLIITISFFIICIAVIIQRKRRKRRTGRYINEQINAMSPNPIYDGSDGRVYETINECSLAKLSWSTHSEDSPSYQSSSQVQTQCMVQNGNHNHDTDDYIAMSSVRGSNEHQNTTRYTTTPL